MMNPPAHHHSLIQTVALLATFFFGSIALAQNDCIDYSDFPNLEANVAVPGVARGMVTQGNYLYVAANLDGLQVVDISDPADPWRVGGLDTPGQSRAVDCIGDLVYLADGTGGLQIISVADPQLPLLVGSLSTMGFAHNLQAVGDFTYLAVDWASGGLIVMDVSDPANPVQISVSPAGGSARDIVVNGNHAYISDHDGNIYVFDVTEPSAPTQVNTVNAGSTASAMDISGSLLAVAVPGEGVQLFDLTDPANPALAGSFPLGFSLNDVFIEGTTGYALNLEQVVLFDLSEPSSPREMTALPLSGVLEAVIVEGNLIFVSRGASGIRVIRDNGFDLPLAVGSLSPEHNYFSGPFDIHNGTAFVISDQLYSVVITNATNPVLAGATAAGQTNHDIDVEGPYAYILTEPNERVLVFNITNPFSPFQVHNFLSGGNTPDRLLTHGNYLYSGAHSAGLGIADITDPPDTYSLEYDGLRSSFHCMAAQGDSLYLGETHNVKIVDISTPTAPVTVGTIDATGRTSGITVQGRYVYIVSPYHGLDIADLEQPGVPIIGHFPGLLFQHVTIHEGIAYVSALRAGVYVLDLSDITQPQLLGIKRGGCVETMVWNDHLVVSGSGYMGGIEILPLQCNAMSSVDDRPQLPPNLQLSAYPNPFNPQTAFSFSLNEAVSVEMTIHDLSGRHVRSLVQGRAYPAGDHTIRWDGRDDQGRRLASGMYFGRLQAGGQQTSHPVILLK